MFRRSSYKKYEDNKNTEHNVYRHLYKRSESTIDINEWSSIFWSFRYTKNNSDRGKNSLKVCLIHISINLIRARLQSKDKHEERLSDNLQQWCKQCNLVSPCGQPSFQLSWCPFRHTKGSLQGKNQLWTFNKDQAQTLYEIPNKQDLCLKVVASGTLLEKNKCSCHVKTEREMKKELTRTIQDQFHSKKGGVVSQSQVFLHYFSNAIYLTTVKNKHKIGQEEERMRNDTTSLVGLLHKPKQTNSY